MKRSHHHTAVDCKESGGAVQPAWACAQGLPDDVWRQVMQHYKPRCAVDWLRLIATSKRLAQLLHANLLLWLHRLALPLTRVETELISGVRPGPERMAIFFNTAFPDGVWAGRCALAAFVGGPYYCWTKFKTMRPLDDFLTDLHILSDAERRYDAAGLSWLLWPLHVAESAETAEKKKPKCDTVLKQFRNRFLWRLGAAKPV